MNNTNTPVVLCFSGLDPTGGAGIQADIEAISNNGGHAAPIITANTVQNTHNVFSFVSIDAAMILMQARTILEDMPVSAIKIGMLGSANTAKAIHTLLLEHSDIPVIFDPVLAAGGGTSLAKNDLLDAISTLIIPHTCLLTPNLPEAQHLTDSSNAEHAAQQLNEMGTQYVLLTGTHADSPDVVHQLYHRSKNTQNFTYQRLQNDYHGSGCTLAASAAVFIAQQQNIAEACHHALDYTYKTLQQAQPLGGGQLIPRRHV